MHVPLLLLLLLPHLCLSVVFIREVEGIAVEEPGVQVQLEIAAAAAAARYRSRQCQR
jgi:hypothetical protein